MIDSTPICRKIASIGLLLGLMLLVGCGTADQRADEVPAEEPVPETDGLQEDELADHPCGNPNWEEPPPAAVSLDDIEAD